MYEELKWFYGDKDNMFSAKQIAQNMYNTLDHQQLYFNNDNEWDNIDLVQDMLHSLRQNDNLNADLMDSSRKYETNHGIRKCRYYSNMRMCAIYNPYRNEMQVQMALPHARIMRQKQNKETVPDNFAAMFTDNSDHMLYDDMDFDDITGDDEDEYEYTLRRMMANDYDDDIEQEEYDDLFYANDDDYEDYFGEYYNDIDSLDEEWDYTSGDQYFDNNNVFDAEKFEYGDALGFKLHQDELMDVTAFKCLNCNGDNKASETLQASAQQDIINELDDMDTTYESNEQNILADMLDIGYDAYGDYIYYFDDRAFNFVDDHDWKSIDIASNEKCTLAIPGLDHKLCVIQYKNDKDYNIRLEAASKQEIDDAYYDLYGYDEYYYNMNSNDDEDNDEYGYYDSDSDDGVMDRHLHARYGEHSYYGDANSDLDRDTDYNIDGTLKRHQGKIMPREYDGHDEGIDMESLKAMDNLLTTAKNVAQQVKDQLRQGSGQRQHQYERRRLIDMEIDDKYDIDEYYNQNYYDETDFTEILSDELSSMLLNFHSDGDWDEIHRVDTMDNARHQYDIITPYDASKIYDGDTIQKCKTLQTAQICATLDSDGFKVNVRVGVHKHFKLTSQKLDEEYAALVDEFGDEYDYDEYEYDNNNDSEEEEEQEEDAVDTFMDELDNEWVVTNQVTNEYDMDWLDNSKWNEINKVMTFNARSLQKKCMNIFDRKLCLCEFLDFVDGSIPQKHVCHPGKAKELKKTIKNKKVKQTKKLNKMKKKLIKAEKKRIKKQGKIVHKKMKKAVKKYERKVKKLKKKMKRKKLKKKIKRKKLINKLKKLKKRKTNTKSIQKLYKNVNEKLKTKLKTLLQKHKLHGVTGYERDRFGFGRPHHHRHLHVHKHEHIPWKMYSKYAKQLPKNKPQWLPQWIWTELHQNFKALAMDENDYDMNAADKEYYDYYEYLNDYYSDELYDDVVVALAEDYNEYDDDDVRRRLMYATYVDIDDDDQIFSDITDDITTDDVLLETDDEIIDELLDGDYNLDEQDQLLDQLIEDEIEEQQYDNEYELNDQYLDQLIEDEIEDGQYDQMDMDNYESNDEEYDMDYTDYDQSEGDEYYDDEYAYDTDEYYDDSDTDSNSYDSDDENDIDLDRIDVSHDLADEWFDDSDDETWTILEQVENQFNDEWNDNQLWDQITPNIKTISGHSCKRKCMTIFGRKLCLCQFVNWVKYGNTKHECGRKTIIVKRAKIKKKKQMKKLKNKTKKIKKKNKKKLVKKKKAILKKKIKKKIAKKKKAVKKIKKKIKKKIAKKQKAVKKKLTKEKKLIKQEKHVEKKKKKQIKKELKKESALHKKILKNERKLNKKVKKAIAKKKKSIRKEIKSAKKAEKKIVKKELQVGKIKKKIHKNAKKVVKEKKKLNKLNKSKKVSNKILQKSYKPKKKLTIIHKGKKSVTVMKKSKHGNSPKIKKIKLKKIPAKIKKLMNKNPKAFKLKMKHKINNKINGLPTTRLKMMHRFMGGMPAIRPKWLPHYYWHWLYHPHRHRYHHRGRRWKLWSPKFRKLIRFVRAQHDGFAPPGPMPIEPPPFMGMRRRRRVGRPMIPRMILKRILNIPPPFMHPTRLQFMLLRKPKLFRKLQRAKWKGISGHKEDDYSDLLEDYYDEMGDEDYEDVNADDDVYEDYEDNADYHNEYDDDDDASVDYDSDYIDKIIEDEPDFINKNPFAANIVNNNEYELEQYDMDDDDGTDDQEYQYEQDEYQQNDEIDESDADNEYNYEYTSEDDDNTDDNMDANIDDDDNNNANQEYYYDEKQVSDEEYGKYFNGDETVEEQNGDLEPDIFWTNNIFAILCGVVFSFFAIIYCLRSRKRKYSFMKLQNKTTDQEDSVSDSSQNNQYGFRHVNISLDDDEDDVNDSNVNDEEWEQQHQPLQHGQSSVSDDDDDDEYGSDEQNLRSKKHQEIDANQYK